jgi:hypothetical protein
VPNHVIYDRIWQSKKLEQCSDLAAAWYAWVFLVADEWGRFEYHPRAIWGEVFRRRPNVTLEQVTAWLQEYERVGLLIRYHINGELAVWTNFIGRKYSERKASSLPDPADFPEVLERCQQLNVKLDGRADAPRRRRGKSAEDPRQKRAPGAGDPRLDREQERDREAEHDREAAPPPAGGQADVPPMRLLPATDPPPATDNPLLDRGALRTEFFALVKTVAFESDRDPAEVAAEHSKYTSREGRTSQPINPDNMTPDRLFQTVLSLRKARAELDAKRTGVRPRPLTDEEVAARQRATVEERRPEVERGLGILREAVHGQGANGGGGAQGGARAPSGGEGDVGGGGPGPGRHPRTRPP